MIARSGFAGPRSIAEGDAEWITRPRAAIASKVALAMLGAIFVSACDSDAKLDSHPDEPAKLAPVIIVTKTEITYQGKVVATHESKMVDGKVVLDRDALEDAVAATKPPEPRVDCDAVAAKVPSVLFAYDPGYFTFAAQVRPKVRESCIEDAWPEPLRRCIVTPAPDKLVHDRACGELVPDELSAKVATRFGVAPSQVQAMLGR